MSPEKQNIAIAKACPSKVDWHDGEPYWQGMYSSVGEGNEHFAKFDPVNDLNAMREAVQILTKEQRREFVRQLYQLTKDDFDFHFATAAQYSEAFLKILNLWQEDKEEGRG